MSIENGRVNSWLNTCSDVNRKWGAVHIARIDLGDKQNDRRNAQRHDGEYELD